MGKVTVNGQELQTGTPYTDKHDEPICGGPLPGFQSFSSLTEIRENLSREGASFLRLSLTVG